MLDAVRAESYIALLFFRQFQPEWHPGQSIGLDPYVQAKKGLLRALGSGPLDQEKSANIPSSREITGNQTGTTRDVRRYLRPETEFWPSRWKRRLGDLARTRRVCAF